MSTLPSCLFCCPSRHRHILAAHTFLAIMAEPHSIMPTEAAEVPTPKTDTKSTTPGRSVAVVGPETETVSPSSLKAETETKSDEPADPTPAMKSEIKNEPTIPAEANSISDTGVDTEATIPHEAAQADAAPADAPDLGPGLEVDHDDNDSALGDAASVADSTASMAESILKYRKENGRTYHGKLSFGLPTWCSRGLFEI